MSDSYEIPSLLNENTGSYELELELRPSGAEQLVLTLSNDKGEKLHMHYDVSRSQFVMDRSQSGLTTFNPDFPAMTVAPAACDGTIRLRLLTAPSACASLSTAPASKPLATAASSS